MSRQSTHVLRTIQRLTGSVSAAALLCLGASALSQPASAQGTPPQGVTTLPPVSVDITKPKKRPKRAARTGPRVAAPAPPPPAPAAPVDSQDLRTGTVGVYANSTSVATKTNTPLVNIPQSVDVITRDFIRDNNFQTLTDVTRYVPGVAIHQGEGNRDELVIRGVDSSANFFVNGFRDDVQYFRDLYNAQSVEILKGPSALIFGRGAGGGLVNRTLKEADWNVHREVTATTGSYFDRRVTTDVGQGINENVAVRLNAMYEQSDTFRDYGHFERYGINPTATFRIGDDTKVKLSYEYYHDERLADRGNPSQSNTNLSITTNNNAVNAANAATIRLNPQLPFVSNWSTLFGSPVYNGAYANVQMAMAFIEHDFGNGLSVKNGTIYASYLRGYRNVYPGNGTLAGAVNTAQTTMNLAAYENATNRNNAFNQTDFTYKTYTGPVKHTLMFGTEFGLQSTVAQRDTGFFPETGLSNTVTVNPFMPTYFGPVIFKHIASDANSRSNLGVQSGYVQDQMEITRYFQLIAGVRQERYDLTANDLNTNTQRNRVDDLTSPRGAVIVKPMENLSIYGAYSTSYLPASGDQFSALTDGTLILQPQKFENKEVGVKWNIFQNLLFTAAAYELIRTNVPIADPSRAGFFFPSGAHKIQGFETTVKGYVTDAWQTSLGYAYTDARITSATSPTIVPGNIVQLVPLHQFALWNKYQFTPMWSAALGVIYFSDSFASSDNTVKLPAFVRFDAGIFAQIDKTWRMQLNVENIFDTGYWASADGNNNISPGQGRTFRLTAIANY
jgi:catecholate siderophore receptor